MAINRYNKPQDSADILKDIHRRLKSLERHAGSGLISATSFLTVTEPWVAEGPGGDHAAAVGTLWINPEEKNTIRRWSDQGEWAPVRDLDIIEVAPDGNPPATSPDPMVLSGINFFIVRWTPITNHDPVTYEIHVSTTLGFTATAGDPLTLVGTTGASQFTVKRLPGALPAEGDPDPFALDPDTTYYVRIIATDADGAAAQSAQAVATVFRVTGVDIQADTITAANILAGTLTGDLFAATVILAGTFKTAEAGQRVETGFAGIKGYKSTGELMVSIPTADGEEMLLDGEFIARKITATGALTLQSIDNIFEAGSVVELARGIVPPAATPIVGPSYDVTHPDTTGLTAANKTGALGTFDLIPTEVRCIEWKDSSPDYWVIHQERSNGTRAWFFRVDNGDPLNLLGGTTGYFTDYVDWAYYSVYEITNSSSPSKNGVYRMGRWIPSGTANTYYLQSPFGLNRYSRQNGSTNPALVTEGNDIGVLESLNTDDLSMRFFTPNGDGNNLSAPFASYTSTTGFSASVSLCTAFWDATGFGAGTGGKYAVAERGTASTVKHLTISGLNLYPGGSGNNWASANKDAESWESPTSNRRGIAWDPANSCFWTYGGDGYMYKHTAEQWDPAVASSTYWAKQTLYDSVGTTHETNPGDFKWYTAKRRSKNTFTPPAIPGAGGADEPNAVRLYMARGSTSPANSAYHLQAEVTGPTSFTTLATATANPPTTNNFPLGTAAKITNDDGTLEINGDALVKAASFLKGTDPLAIEGPKAFWYLSATYNIANGGGNVDINAWVADGATNSSEITMGSGQNITVTRAGLYKISAGITYPVNGTGSRRYMQIFTGTSGGTVILFASGAPSANAVTICQGSRTVRLAASAVFRVTAAQDSTTNPLAILAGNQFCYLQVEYVGP